MLFISMFNIRQGFENCGPWAKFNPLPKFVNKVYQNTTTLIHLCIGVWLLSLCSNKTDWLRHKLCSPHNQNIYYPVLYRKCLPIPVISVTNCDDLRNAIKLLNLFSTEEMQISLIFFLFCQLAFSISFLFCFIHGQFSKEQKLITEKGSSPLSNGLCAQRASSFLMHFFHRNILNDI